MKQIKENRYTKMKIKNIKNLKNWQAFVAITLVGFITYFDGLINAFQGDDIPQIVNNTAVHSLAHIGQLFTSSTFYSISGNSLSGTYYRPLMDTTFAFLYSLFGAHPFYFHLFQLLLGIGSSIILYLFFRYSFSKFLSLILAILFLVHPIDSQAIFAIPSMQDALFFFFGILALYSILRFKSVRSLVPISLCLFLSLLSKETGILFVFMAGVLIYFWNRPRFKPYLYIMAPLTIIWFILRLHAVHLLNNPNAAPIDSASLYDRLLTLPSILQFYLTKLILPFKIGAFYYWVHKNITLKYVILPLVIDLAVLGLIIYSGRLLKKKGTKAQHKTYWFFAAWFGVGLFTLSNIIPVDMTATTLWFYFPMVGVLGMIGIVINARVVKVNWSRWNVATPVLLLIILYIGLSMNLGLVWKSTQARFEHDISVSKGNFLDYQGMSTILIGEGKYNQAKTYALESNDAYPTYLGYFDLGVAYAGLGDYSDSLNAYNRALQYHPSATVNPELLYNDMAMLALTTNANFINNRQLLEHFLSVLTNDSNLWTSLALLDQKNGDNADAKIAITKAATYGSVDPTIYNDIMQNKSFVLHLTGPNYTQI